MRDSLAYAVFAVALGLLWGLDSIADGLKEIAKAIRNERAP